MTWLVFIGLALAGGVGAALRMLLDGLISSRTRARINDRTSAAMPWATILINISGSLALGFITGLTAQQLLPEAWHLIIGAGFLGGYTTFSTASVDTVRLAQEHKWLASLSTAVGTLVLATGAAGLGLWLGGLV